MRTCSICPRPYRARGFCSTHYNRLMRGADPTVEPYRFRMNEAYPFFLETYLTPAAHDPGWPGAIITGGYGILRLPTGRRVQAHVLACEMVNGPRPPGLETAHSCKQNRLCFYAEHLRWATHRENFEDSVRDGTATYLSQRSSCSVE